MALSGSRTAVVCAMLAALLSVSAARAQERRNTPDPAAPAGTAAKDALGRETPRGTLLGFMNAARERRDELAVQYLNTRLRGAEATDLARKLFVVLDSRLPSRLSDLSDRREGSLANPLKPNQDVIGTIATEDGTLDLVLERVNQSGSVWLFSRETLDAIPDVYADVDLLTIDRFLPDFLVKRRIAGIRLFEWLALALVIPVCYRLTGLFGRLLRPLIIVWRRRRGRAGDVPATLVPGCVRLLLIAIGIRWLLGVFALPLLERMFWSGIATVLVIIAAVWALLLANAVVERYVHGRFRASGHGDVTAMLRLARRLADLFAVAAGLLVTLHFVGIDPTAALAGLGIGGIAVALAAQKTLENVIGGLSIIFDQAVRVGDFLRVGEAVGTVDYIGLRSTRIRTLERTVLSVPNGQIANANIETLSARDKFWFHHVFALRYETTAGQLRTVLTGLHTYLTVHPMVDPGEPIRVRFIRCGAFSFDIEVFAYVRAVDWDAFLGTQQELLLEVLDIIDRAGAALALPSQTLHLHEERRDGAAAGPIGLARSARLEPRLQAGGPI